MALLAACPCSWGSHPCQNPSLPAYLIASLLQIWAALTCEVPPPTRLVLCVSLCRSCPHSCIFVCRLHLGVRG